MLSSRPKEFQPNSYTTLITPDDLFKATIVTPSTSYTLSKKIAQGAYGIVHDLKEKTNYQETTSILYETAENIHSNYVLKQIYDTQPYETAFNKEELRKLRVSSDNSLNLSKLSCFSNENFISIAKTSNYQIAVYEEFQKKISATELFVPKFLAKKEIKRAEMLEEAANEAAYTTQYHHNIGENKVVVLQGQPRAAIEYHCQEGKISIHYCPAIAIAMPKIIGVTLDRFPEKKFHKGFSFTLLLKLLKQIADAFDILHNKAKILHLDASTSNLMYEPQKDRVRFLDFGLAQSLIANSAPIVINRYDEPQDRSKCKYLRQERFLSEHSTANDSVTVGVEDDAFALAVCAHYLLQSYEKYVEKLPLSIGLIHYFEQIKNSLDQPGVSMSNAISLIQDVILLVSDLHQLEKTNDNNEILNRTTLELQEITPHLEQQGATQLAAAAEIIVDEAQVNILAFSLSKLKISANKENNTGNITPKSTQALFAVGTYKPASSTKKNSRGHANSRQKNKAIVTFEKPNP